MISVPGLRPARLVQTDGEGRYEFLNLPANRYTLSVNKAGYVSLQFGQRRPFEGGRPIDIADGQTIEGIDFALPRGSVITGRITDENGDPVVGAQVQALMYRYGPDGRRRLASFPSQSLFSNRTNDLGEYRLFGLMPGSYVVSAFNSTTGVVSLTQSGPGPGRVSGLEARDGFVETFFPGSANAAEAQTVIVNLSEEVDASFSLSTARMAKISGMVRQSDGKPPMPGSEIFLRPNDTNGSSVMGWGFSQIAPDGSFGFANVPPGAHVLEIGRQRGNPSQRIREFAVLPITVAGSDVTGLTLVTKPGVSVSGKAIFPTSAARDSASRPRIVTSAVDSNANIRGSLNNGGTVDDAGGFQIRDVFGPVLFRAAPGPSDVVLKSVTLNGTDITDRPFNAVADTDGLEIVFAMPAQMSGVAKNAKGEAVKDFRVALFPARSTPSVLTQRFMRTATADPSGRYEIGALPPGEYAAVALESFDQGDEWDPAFQQRVLPAARRIIVVEGQSITIDLPYLE